MNSLFDRTTDNAEIPEEGERLDQTIKQVGVANSWDPETEEKLEACIVKTVVDNGVRAGKNLSFPLFSYPIDLDRFREFANVVGADTEIEATPVNMARVLRDVIGQRFSAMVHTVKYETDHGRYLRYRMTFFGPPEDEAEMELDLQPTQFQR